MTVVKSARRGLRVCLLLSLTALLGRAATAQTDSLIPPDSETHGAQPPAATFAAAGVMAPNLNCTLIVPKNPLTASGLATPYQLLATDPLQGPCNESNTAQSAFVQAAILDPATGTVAIYNPLVIDRGSSPAEAPVVPALPPGAVVATWFGFNGNKLTLQTVPGEDIASGLCVNGSGAGVFGQFAYCNAPAFFKAAHAAVASGQLRVPPLGIARDGQPCPSARDFFVVDQDQGDNLPTVYLLTAHGRTAQYTERNLASSPLATPLGNPSDHRLLDVFLKPALGCEVWTAPDLADPGHRVSALALNELQARVAQKTPVALVPAGDPMTQVNGNEDRTKTNLYRRGVDQPMADTYFDLDTARYCRQILRIAPGRLAANRALLARSSSPDTGAADSLYTFMAQRLVATYDALSCATLINQPDPVSVQTNEQGVAVGVSVDRVSLNRSLQRLAAQMSEDDAADSAQKAMQRTE